MAEMWVAYDTERESAQASRDALVSARGSRTGLTTQYLFEWRLSTDGKWYLIMSTDNPKFAHYKRLWYDKLSAESRGQLTRVTAEPEWAEIDPDDPEGRRGLT